MGAYLGMSCFGGSIEKFPTKRFLQQYPEGLKKAAIAIMPGSFGWDVTTISKFQALGFPKIMVEIHIANGPGRRRGSWSSDLCPQYSIDEWDAKLKNRNGKVLLAVRNHMIKLFNWLPDCPAATKRELVVCPELEDNISDEAWDILAGEIRKHLPLGTKIVRSPCTGGCGGTRELLERHGAFPTPNKKTILNSDGCSVNLSDDSSYDNCMSISEAGSKMKSFVTKAHSIMIWHHDQQGWHGVSDFHMTIPPLERTYVVTNGAISIFNSLISKAAGL